MKIPLFLLLPVFSVFGQESVRLINTTDRETGRVQITAVGGKTTVIEEEGCQIPALSPSGNLVGWTWGKESSASDTQHEPLWINSTLRIRAVGGGKVIEFKSEKPFIEKWQFSEDEKSVVVLSRGYRGPAIIQRFFLDQTTPADRVDAFAENPPDWAKAFSEAP